MSRTIPAIAAAIALTALSAGAMAQSPSTGMAPAGPPSAMTSPSPSTGMAPPMSGMGQPMPSTGMSAPMSPPAMGERGMRREMRHERRAMHRQMRADRRAAENPDGAYMGGGGVYERAPDGSLRPAR